jgi:hypothetical protein
MNRIVVKAQDGGTGVTERPCPRCGVEAGIPGLPQAMAMAAALPIAPSLRAADDVYHTRLKRCAACNALREQVLCAYCGCLIPFRARVQQRDCPHPAGSRWAETQDNFR